MSQYFDRQPWWTLPTTQFPPAFRNDRREVEVERLSSLLTYSERDLDHNLRTRVRRATTLLESAALDNYNGVTSDRWEVIALLQETLGVIDRDKQEGSVARIVIQVLSLPQVLSSELTGTIHEA